MGKPLPDHCCCCGLRPGAFVIGAFTLVVTLPLTGLLAAKAARMHASCPRDRGWCPEDRLTMVNLYALSAVLDGLEALVTCAFLRAVYRYEVRWVSRWLFLSVGWWLQHSVLAVAVLLSSVDSLNLLVAAIFVPFLWSMFYLCMRTVAGLRRELLWHERRMRGAVSSTSNSAPAPAPVLDDAVQL